MLWMFLAKDTLYLTKDKEPLVLKPIETTVEEENFRHRFSINEFVYPTQINKGHFGETVPFYYLVGGIVPVGGFSFSVRGMPPTSNRIYVNGLPLTNMMLTGLSPLPFNEGIISSAYVYRGDAPVEYDGFLGGVIDMSVEPLYNKAQAGVPTTYVFYRGFYGQYSNPTYLNVPVVGDPNGGRTENYSFALVQRIRSLKLTALYSKVWLSTSAVHVEPDGDVIHIRNAASLRGYGASLMYSHRALKVSAYVSGTDNFYYLGKTYGLAQNIVYTPENISAGIRVQMMGIGIEILKEQGYSGFGISDAVSDTAGVSPPVLPFTVEHKDLSVFWGRRWNAGKGFLYTGVRLNRSLDTVWGDSTGGWEYGVRGWIPTFRIHYKFFLKDFVASKIFLGSSYQNFAPFFSYPIMEVMPTPYFKRYPYVITGVYGLEFLIGDYAAEVNAYGRFYDPHIFYNWGDTTVSGGTFADIMLQISKEARAISVGLDFTLLDKAKRNFRVSGFVGKSKFISGVEGSTPWDMRWAIALQMDLVSVFFTDGVPVYGWREICLDWDNVQKECREKKITFSSVREFFTLTIGAGKSFRWRGMDVKYGIGNVLFLWNRAWWQAKFDPVAIYKTTPMLYLYVVKEW